MTLENLMYQISKQKAGEFPEDIEGINLVNDYKDIREGDCVLVTWKYPKGQNIFFRAALIEYAYIARDLRNNEKVINITRGYGAIGTYNPETETISYEEGPSNIHDFFWGSIIIRKRDALFGTLYKINPEYLLSNNTVTETVTEQIEAKRTEKKKQKKKQHRKEGRCGRKI